MTHLESKIQHEAVKSLRHEGFLVFAVINDSGGNARKMGLYIAMGLLPGVSDTVVVFPGRCLFLEFKTPTGRQSPQQLAFQSKVQAKGHFYEVARSAEEALTFCRKYDKITTSETRGLVVYPGPPPGSS